MKFQLVIVPEEDEVEDNGTEVEAKPAEIVEVEAQTDKEPSMLWRIGNAVTFGLCVVSNYIVGSKIGEISRKNEVKITPDGWAFSIWGIIYSLLAGFAFFQYTVKTSRFGAIVKDIGPFFIIGNICNATWLVTWTRGTPFWISFSSILLLSLLASNLIILHLAKSFKPDNGHGIYEFIFIDVAFSIYAGWTTVASILNVAISLMVNKWDGFGINPSYWGALMVLVAAEINVVYLFREGNTVVPLVFCWACFAIFTKQSKTDNIVGGACILCVLGVFMITWIYESHNNALIKRGKKASLSRDLLIYK